MCVTTFLPVPANGFGVESADWYQSEEEDRQHLGLFVGNIIGCCKNVTHVKNPRASKKARSVKCEIRRIRLA